MRKVVVVTGAFSGIGEETAKIYARKGYFLVLNGEYATTLDAFVGKNNIDLIVGDIASEEVQNRVKDILEHKLTHVFWCDAPPGFLVTSFEVNPHHL